MNKKLSVQFLSVLLCISMVFSSVAFCFGTETTDVRAVCRIGYTYYAEDENGKTNEYSLMEITAAAASIEVDFAYSDGFFFTDNKEVNDYLADLSINQCLCAYACGSVSDGQCPNAADSVKAFLTSIGFSGFCLNDDYLKESTKTSMGFMFSFKELTYKDGSSTGKYAVAVTFREDYTREWASNFTVGASGEHAGFAAAADAVMTGLADYLAGNQTLAAAVSSGNVVFWVTGHSRAGFVANLASKRIVDSYCGNNTLCSYCFADGYAGSTKAMQSGKDYSVIHNFVSEDDVADMVVPTSMDSDLCRYGTDVVLDSEVSEEIENTYEQLTGGDDWNQDFHLAYFKINLKDTGSISTIYNMLTSEEGIAVSDFLGVYDSSQYSSQLDMKQYLRDAIAYFRIWAVYGTNRNTYSYDTYSYGISGITPSSMQTALANVSAYLFSADNETISRLGKIFEASINADDFILKIISYSTTILNWWKVSNDGSDLSTWEKITYNYYYKEVVIEYLWNMINDADVAKWTDDNGTTWTLQSAMGDFYTEFKNMFPLLLNSALTFFSYDYGNYYADGSVYKSLCGDEQCAILLSTLIYNILEDGGSLVTPHLVESYAAKLHITKEITAAEGAATITVDGTVVFSGKLPEDTLIRYISVACFDEYGRYTGTVIKEVDDDGNIVGGDSSEKAAENTAEKKVFTYDENFIPR